MEHLERFGLSRDPFRNDSQLDFYFESASHAHAKQRLVRCLRQGKELCVLVGEVGSGTTTLARVLFEELEPERFEAGMLVVARGIEAAWLRTAIARQLGIEDPSPERAAAVRQLYERLVALHEQGRRAIVAIDEAQALAGSEALADLVALLNFEHEDARLLSAVLIGSPALEGALAREPALLGRVELRVRLEPLSPADARAYLAHRLRVAGGDPSILSPEVMDAIAARASGIPRRINALADNALFEAHLASRRRATVSDVERAARDLPWARGGDELAPERSEADVATAIDEEVASALEEPTELLEAPAPPRRRPMPVRTPDLDSTIRAGEFDEGLLETDAPDQTQPGAWRTAAPVAPKREPLTDEDELDGLFVDLVDEA
ncbi:MAG TPA: AAA family ATPase [Myxococcota bacterium]|nr:AAA family ATPase [Myxococcota bacterium]